MFLGRMLENQALRFLQWLMSSPSFRGRYFVWLYMIDLDALQAIFLLIYKNMPAITEDTVCLIAGSSWKPFNSRFV